MLIDSVVVMDECIAVEYNESGRCGLSIKYYDEYKPRQLKR